MESNNIFHVSHAKYVEFFTIVMKTNDMSRENEFYITSDNLGNNDVEKYLNQYMGEKWYRVEGHEIVAGVPDRLWL